MTIMTHPFQKDDYDSYGTAKYKKCDEKSDTNASPPVRRKTNDG